MKTLFLILTLSCTAILSNNVHSQTLPPPPQNISDGLQQLLDNALPGNFSNPGAVLGVVVPGQWAWYGATGNAISGTTSGFPATNAQADTRYRVGSITKLMVSTCILKLEEDGMLSVDDPIDLYLRPTLMNDTINASSTITIKNLLNHTSGIANSAANNSCQLNILSNLTASHTLEEAVFCGASQGELFSPGTDWTYSNTNYTLLAMIIQEVTGMTYSDYISQTIFTPMGMTNTEIPTTDEINGDHMGCYWNIMGNWTDLTIIDATTYTGWADVVSNTHDLTLFMDSLLNWAIIGQVQLDKMKTIDPVATNYGLGMEFRSILGDAYFGHYGEVGNTNGLFYCQLGSSLAPYGYYYAYNYNTQGVAMVNKMDTPLYHFMKGDLGVESIMENASIYPNPVNDQMNVDFNSAGKRRLTLTDLTGKEISFIETNDLSLAIDVKGVSPGNYLLLIQSETSNQIRQIQIK